MANNHKYKSAFPYLGGKMVLLDRIYPYFPKHIHYVDVFGGSLAVTINKIPSIHETVNDINGHVINFFKVLREQPEKLIEKIKLTPFSREEFNQAWIGMHDQNLDPVERARCFYIRARQSYGATGMHQMSNGWRRTNFNGKSNASVWINTLNQLYEIAERLQNVQIENRDAFQLLHEMDNRQTFFYVDPPYVMSTRTGKKYSHEMDDMGHITLISILNRMKGKVMLSGYESELYQEHLHDHWTMIKFPFSTSNIGKSPKQTCIWMNYQENEITDQLSLEL